VSCNDCLGGKVCASHACVCATCGSGPGTWQCGSGPDGCGGTLNCGGCSGGVCTSDHRCDN
jgi:hypothetical protein